MKQSPCLALTMAFVAFATGRISGGDPPTIAERNPQEVFQKACERLQALEGKYGLLKGMSKVKPSIERDDNQRLKSAEFVFERNAMPPGKNPATANDDSMPFVYVSVAVWSGRSHQPPAGLHQLQWKGQTYQMWVRVFGSDAELVNAVRKAVDEPLRGPFAPKK
jgi:hypothetical protein